ncbi:hypothetical protein Agub_g14234, partial [Astrephomene gubernaculifera]
MESKLEQEAGSNQQDQAVSEDEPQPSQVWLLPELLDRIAGFMSPNDICCTLRPISKATVAQFSNYTTVRLSASVPHGTFAQKWDNPDAMRGLTLRQRRNFLNLTARSGNLENLQLAAKVAGCTLTIDLFEAAASGGQVHICTWLRQEGCPWGWQVTAAAARAGQLETLKYLHQEGCCLGDAALEAAALTGHRSICEWLLDNNGGWSFWAICAAARGGHDDLMEWLLLRLIGPVLPATSLCVLLLEAVAEGCDLPTLQRVQTDYLTITEAQGGSGAFFNPVRGIDIHPDLNGRLLSAAVASPTPDWQDKVKWLLSLPQSPIGTGGSGNGSFTCAKAAALPDALSRLRWLSQLQKQQPQQQQQRQQ